MENKATTYEERTEMLEEVLRELVSRKHQAIENVEEYTLAVSSLINRIDNRREMPPD